MVLLTLLNGSELIAAARTVAEGVKLSPRRPHGVIHHPDHGRQYTALVFGKRCRELGFVPSHGFVGNAYDNAIADNRCATIE